MKILFRSIFLLVLTALGVMAQPRQQIEVRGETEQAIPVSLSGFTGEVDGVLKFDLAVAGFDLVGPDQAQYLITGSNAGGVEGRVTDRYNKASLLAIRYTTGPLRSQAHALSDAIVQAVSGRKGIAQTKIAFKIDRGKESEIGVADYDGYNAMAVTSDKSLVAAPCWAPKQRVLFYTSYKLENPDIYSHDLSSGAREVVARYSGLNTSPAVSPDGSRVAFILSKSGSPDVWVADRYGKNPVQLTKTKEAESSPCWSGDGQMICFVSRESGSRPGLYTVPAGGGAMRRLRTDGAANPTEPDWSPDGKWIAFTTMRGGGFDICVVEAKEGQGGEARVLVAGEDPSWAANSRTLIFSRRARGGRVLSLLDVPTKRVKDVNQTLGSSSQPAWAR